MVRHFPSQNLIPFSGLHPVPLCTPTTVKAVQMVMESVLIFRYHSTGVKKACIYVISHICEHVCETNSQTNITNCFLGSPVKRLKNQEQWRPTRGAVERRRKGSDATYSATLVGEGRETLPALVGHGT